MVFKLVRTDTEEPFKIQLPIGTHLLGRGKFLECDDKRVSRNHSELQVTEDTVILKALHQNPCFFIKKGIDETQVLKLNCTTDLNNGDKFGLLPNSYWYELLYCAEQGIGGQSPVPNNQETTLNINGDNTLRNETRSLNDSQEPLTFDFNENTDVGNRESQLVIDRAESPSLVQPGSPSYTQADGSPSLIQIVNQPSTQDTETPDPAAPPDQAEEPKTPLKRSHSPDPPSDVKQLKTEPAVVKQEPQDATPGPSNEQGALKADNSGNVNDPAAPAKPPDAAGPGRERCMYGAGCYRKNPEHKLQFSHPADADWGPGARGACPWGRGCQRADPRHWRDHEHPPGAAQPTPGRRPGMQVVQRNGNIFYINAHAVNFHDDHFQVEDQDGDSVDFDYEF